MACARDGGMSDKETLPSPPDPRNNLSGAGWLLLTNWPGWSGYVLAAAVTGLTLLIRTNLSFADLDPLLEVFLLPIIFSAYVGGLGSGFLATVMVGFLSAYFLMPPIYNFSIASGSDRIEWAVLMIAGVLISVLSEGLHRARRQTEASRQLQTITLASIGDAVITTDALGRISFLNSEAERLTGWKNQDAVGRELTAVFQLINAQTRELISNPAQKVLHDRTAVELSDQILLITRDGRELPIDDSGAPISRPNGSVVGVVLVFRDISAKIRADAALRKSERTLKLFVEHAPAAIAMFDINMHYLAASRRFLSDYRLKDQDIIGRSHYEIFPEIPERWKEIHRHCLAGAIEHAQEDPFPREDGTLDWVRWEIHPWYERPNEIGGLILFSEVITERKRAEQEIRESEVRFHSALDSMLEGCQIIGFDWRYLYVNDSVALHGRQTKADLLGRTMIEVYPGIETTPLFSVLQRCMQERTPVRIENRFDYGDGLSSWFDLSVQPSPEGLFILSIDITERRRVESALRQSEQRFATAFQASPAAMAITRLSDGRFIDVNVAYERLFEYHREELIGRTGIDVDIYTGPEQRAEVVRLLREQGWLRSYELTLRAKSGTLHDVLFSLELIELDDETCAITIVYDITDRKRAEHARLRSTDRLRVLADASRAFAEVTDYQVLLDQIVKTTTAALGDGCTISLISEDGAWLYPLAIYDIDPEKHNFRRAMLNAARIRVDDPQLITRVFQSQQSVLVPVVDLKQIRDITKPAYQALVESSGIHSMIGVPILAQGQVIGAMVLYRHRPEQPPFDEDDLRLAQDLADRAGLAISNARLRVQIEQYAQDLERRVQDRTAELEAANKELEAFSYSVSHDLRAPLRAIDGFSRILLEDYVADLPADAQRYFQLVRDNAQQMGRLVDDLLAFSRLGRQTLARRTVDPGEIVQQCFAELSGEQADRQIVLNIGDLPSCQADPALLKQIWINLIANALKYTRRCAVAEITIGARMEAGRAIYFVKDNGVGFDMRYADKLFGVFQRLHRAEDYEGTGVGLAIVQRIIHRHGGQIWAEAEVDKGAIFYFTIEGT